MLRKFLGSFLLAFHNIRSHFFHTLLSVLGIVIGVASLVSILSLIDGMEEYAKEQITKTTSLNAVVIHTQSNRWVNGVRMKKDTVAFIDFAHFQQLKRELLKPATSTLRATFPSTIQADSGRQLGAMVYGMGAAPLAENFEVKAGATFSDKDVEIASPYALINLTLAKAIDSTSQPGDFIGRILIIKGRSITINAVIDDKATEPRVGIPITILSPAELAAAPPELVVMATDVLHVTPLKEQIIAWLKKNYTDQEGFAVQTNEARVEQAAKGFLLFRIIMGLIVGISVVVGGIGIMNVLLISITERTVEIGIRKAVGANRRDIIFQFLAESITVSAFGSAMGLILGITLTAIVVPVIKALTEIPFYASYTLNTLMVTGILAIALGIIFGTYPAMRAARLDPVEAIRRE
jgi:putative ABC transport system permease protein